MLTYTITVLDHVGGSRLRVSVNWLLSGSADNAVGLFGLDLDHFRQRFDVCV